MNSSTWPCEGRQLSPFYRWCARNCPKNVAGERPILPLSSVRGIRTVTVSAMPQQANDGDV
jgi:hypothetical protein